MVNKQELSDSIRMAGARAAAAARYCQDWDHQLGHQWTSRDAFSHVASTSGALPSLFPLFESGAVGGLTGEQLGQMNQQAIGGMAEKSNDEITRAIIDGQEASAAFVEDLDDGALQKEVELGGYRMPMGELVAQIWVNHQLGHAYEASARWPLT